MKKALWIIGTAALIVSGCGKKADKVAMTAYDRYQDGYVRLNFAKPAGWQVNSEPERVYVYSSPEAAAKFYTYSSEGKDGAMLVVTYHKMDTLKNLDKIVHERQNELSANGFDISEVKAQALGGMPGMLLHYSGVIDANTKVEGLQVQAVKDSFQYSVRYEGFNKLFPACRAAFDTLIATIQVPEAKAKESAADASKPSKTYKPFENNFVKLSLPDNFDPDFPKPKPPVEFAMEIKLYRADSNLRLDIMPGKGLTVEKVVEQNAKLFKEQSRGETKIDGVKALFLNYSPAANVQSRVYFAVINDKIYRVITNYYKPMKADYEPALEKMVASLATK
jgi:hypothetical protein